MLNKCILIGRLVADPEMRYTQSGIGVVNFRIAIDRNYKSASGEKETDFINIVAWRKLAELVNQYLGKGRLVAVEGSLQMRRYQSKEGENRTAYEVVADNVQFLDRGDKGGGSPRNDSPPPGDDNAPPPDMGAPDSAPNDDDLPF
ncbi:MAG: single-stranded DNA-binding protein [Candidatus Hinthialibacter antarcticus]|nr:single-stranded DNA-binding protein [Candidatus Hinthialibacter antarcticus]